MESNFKNIGEYLRATRESKNISLEYICAQTKINFGILKNLENNNISELPNIAYVRGFVQSYLKILGINPSEALDILDKTYNQNNSHKLKTPLAAKESVVEPHTPKEKPKAQGPTLGDKAVDLFDTLMANKNIILSFTLIIGICFGIYGTYQYINNRIKSDIQVTKDQDQTPQESDIKTSDENLFESQKLKEMREENIANTHTSNEGTEVAKEAPKQEAKSVEVIEEKKPEQKKEEVVKTAEKEKDQVVSNTKFPFVKFRKIQASKIYNILEDAKENEDENLLPEEYKDKLNEDIENIYIRATSDKTWLSYSVDDKPVEALILKQGGELFLQGKKILIFMGNVNATKVFYNNKLVDPMSKTGVKSLIFPESIINQQYLPLFKANADGILYRAESYMEKMDEAPVASSTDA